MSIEIPIENTVGTFIFGSPFENVADEKEVLTLLSKRDLKEMQVSGEKPFENIYVVNKLSRDVFDEDLKNGVKIFVFTNTSEKFIYVPSNRVTSAKPLDGEVYQRRVLLFDIGSYPEKEDLSEVIEDTEAFIQSLLGITPKGDEMLAGARIVMTDAEHKDYMARLTENKTKIDTYKSMYEKCDIALKNKTIECNHLEKFVIQKKNEES